MKPEPVKRFKTRTDGSVQFLRGSVLYQYPEGYPGKRQLKHVLARKPSGELITCELTDGDNRNILPCGRDIGSFAAWVSSEATPSTSDVSVGPTVQAQAGGPLQQKAPVPRTRDGSVTRESPMKRQKRKHKRRRYAETSADRTERGVTRSTKPALGEVGVMEFLSAGSSAQARDGEPVQQVATKPRSREDSVAPNSPSRTMSRHEKKRKRRRHADVSAQEQVIEKLGVASDVSVGPSVQAQDGGPGTQVATKPRDRDGSHRTPIPGELSGTVSIGHSTGPSVQAQDDGPSGNLAPESSSHWVCVAAYSPGL